MVDRVVSGRSARSAATTRRALLAIAVVLAACGTSGDDEPSRPSSDDVPPGTALPASAGVQRSAYSAEAPAAELAAGLNDAGLDLLRTLPTEDNVVFSPASIGHALLMVRGAADDATRAAIDAALALPPGVLADQAWNSIDHQLGWAQSDTVTVRFADRIWPTVGLAPDQAWIDLLAAEHGADVVPLDLHRTEPSRQQINRWVSDNTEGLIPELLPQGLIQPETRLVLTDALYFNARWRTVFGKYEPVDGPFTTLDGSQVPTEFMRELGLSDRRGVTEGFAAAELPYHGDRYSMLVIVPDQGNFARVRDRLDQETLDRIDATFTTGPYTLLLPKWDDTYQLDLNPWLEDIGAAPGSYPAIAPGVFLDAAVHAADIAVDEHGTVAAAATGMGFAASGPPTPALTIAADRPFLYLIRHRPTGLVLFAGQVTNPH